MRHRRPRRERNWVTCAGLDTDSIQALMYPPWHGNILQPLKGSGEVDAQRSVSSRRPPGGDAGWIRRASSKTCTAALYPPAMPWTVPNVLRLSAILNSPGGIVPSESPLLVRRGPAPHHCVAGPGITSPGHWLSRRSPASPHRTLLRAPAATRGGAARLLADSPPGEERTLSDRGSGRIRTAIALPRALPAQPQSPR